MHNRVYPLTFTSLGAVLLFCVGSLVALSFFAEPQRTEAQSTTLSGYAWSDTIGWISMSGSNYGIAIDGSGNMSGYAWSDNIGWISAQSADVSGCPAGTCAPRVSGTEFLGWWKAIAADGNGWDGWISLSCQNTGTCGTSNYGISNSSGSYAGYAWGSDIVGWVDFSTVLPPAPTCSITPNPSTIVRGATANLAWTSTNATSGSITVIGNVAPSGNAGVQPLSTTTYTGTFGGAGGYGTCDATVGVTCAPIYSCNGDTIEFTNSACTTSTVTTCVSPNYCTSGQSTCTVPPISFTSMGTSTGHLEARPLIVRTGATTRLFWNVENASSCTVSGNGDSWELTTSGEDGVESNPINSSAIYTLYCEALPGGDPLTITETVTIVPSPIYQEF